MLADGAAEPEAAEGAGAAGAVCAETKTGAAARARAAVAAASEEAFRLNVMFRILICSAKAYRANDSTAQPYKPELW